MKRWVILILALLLVGCLIVGVLTRTPATDTSTAPQYTDAPAAPAASDTPTSPLATHTPRVSPPTDTPTTHVTLDGWDEDAGILIEPINVWKDYDDRMAGIAGKGKHGEKVKFIQRVGDGVEIELSNGKRGWVTYYFIKEFK